MSEENSGSPIRNILVAMDASIHSVAALQVSIDLAACFGAKLTGLFIEDVNLFRLAEFHFAREVSLFTPSFRRIESAQLERQLRAQAGRMRNLLDRGATRAGISWNFRVVRGAVTSEVISAAAGMDLIVLGKRGRSLVGKIGSTARFIISKGRGLTLILEKGYLPGVPVKVLYDGTETSDKAMVAAAHLIKARRAMLTVVLLAAEKDRIRQVRSAAMEHLGSHGLNAGFRVVTRPTASRLGHLIRMEGPGIVVLPLWGDLLQPEELRTLITDIPNPVLLVR